MRSRAAWLASIVLVGAILRFWGILHGLGDGFIYHADAHLAAWSAWHLFLGGPLAPARFGAAHGLLSRVALEAADLAGRALGYPPAWTFALVGSTLAVLTALLGTLTIVATYWLGARAFGRRAGFLAAAFVAVSPLHTFHSHYPYRDVPMVLALTLTLTACVIVAQRASGLACAGAAVGAAVTLALKPGGLVVVAPLAAAFALAWRRHRASWWPVALVAVLVVVLLVAGMAAGALVQGGSSLAALEAAWARAAGLGRFGLRHAGGVGHGAVRAVVLLGDWLGWPMLLAFGAGLGAALWRRRAADLVLAAFVVPGFLAAAMIPWMDERFFVYLVPPAAVLLARAIAGAASRARGRLWVRLAIFLVTIGLLAGDLGRSAWQDVLLSLPDTRALAGRWFEAHVAPSERIAMEGYFPLGVNEWPQASFFEPRRPLAEARAAADILVTSSLEHDRYLDGSSDSRGPVPPAIPRFFRSLPQEVALMRTFALAPVGFAHPTIAVYATRPPRVTDAPALFWPRPYDAAWNGGVATLEPGPYDRDDRTVFLGGAQAHDVVLATPTPVDEVVVFVANGAEPSQVRIDVGWTHRTRALPAGDWQAVHFRPRWWWPGRPALYRVRIGFLPEARTALFQIRAGAREIGEAYASWGRWAAAVPYLERALAARRGDGEVALLLGTAYRQLGRREDARRVAAGLPAAAPVWVAAVRQLGGDPAPAETWIPAFERVTGLDARLLTRALTREIRLESILAEGRLGGDPATPGAVALVFERGFDRPGVVLNGPKGPPRPLLYLESGAYRARFTLRGGAGSAGQESAVLRVFAERRLLATRSVTAAELGDGRRAVDVEVPFVHEGPPTPMAVQVEATGRGSFAVDHVRIEPDLPAAFRQRGRALAALDG